MKKAILLFFSLFFAFSFSQERTIEIDYTVDYIVPNRKKQTTDTISIGFNKSGKYLWTNDKILSDKISSNSLFGKYLSDSDSGINLIYSPDEDRMILAATIGSSKFYADLDMNMIFPFGPEDGFNEEVAMITDKSEKQETVLGKDCNVFNLFPDNEPDQGIKVLIDESTTCNNNNYLSQFVTLMLKLTYSEGSITIDVPNGLILKVLDENDNTLIEAIKVDTSKKTLVINHSIQTKE